MSDLSENHGMTDERPRGDATSKAQRTQRQAIIAEKLAANPTQQEIAAEVGVSVATVKRDLNALNETFKERQGDAIVEHRTNQLTRIGLKWDEIEGSKTMTDAEKHQAWARWMKLEIDLRGTAAPQKHLVGMAVPTRLAEELRAVVGEMDQNQVKRLVMFAHDLLDGNADEPITIPVTFVPAANHQLGFTPQTVIPAPPPLPRKRLAPATPKQLPPILDGQGQVEEEADTWDAEPDLDEL
jgi:transposase